MARENKYQGTIIISSQKQSLILTRKQLVVRVFEYQTNRPGICLTSIGVKSEVDDTVLLLVDKPEEIVAALEQKNWRT